MSHTDFYQYESGRSESKLSKCTRPYLADVSDIEFRRGSLCLHYKLRNNINNNEFLEADVLMSEAKKVISGLMDNVTVYKTYKIRNSLIVHYPILRFAVHVLSIHHMFDR